MGILETLFVIYLLILFRRAIFYLLIGGLTLAGLLVVLSQSPTQVSTAATEASHSTAIEIDIPAPFPLLRPDIVNLELANEELTPLN